jgi:hypothetical protein
MGFPTLAQIILKGDIIVKCWPQFFDPLWNGIKTFDVRLDDRPYQAGKTLTQYEYDPTTQEISGRVVRARITYVLTSADFSGVAPGYICLALTGFQKMVVQLHDALEEQHEQS